MKALGSGTWKLALPWMLASAVIGCADAGTLTGASPAAPRPEVVGSDPPKPWPVKITSANVTVWESGAIDSDMRFEAYHGRIGGGATVTDDVSSASYTFQPQEKHTILSYDNSFSRRDHVTVRRSCGTDILASMKVDAWWQVVSNGGTFAVDSDTRAVEGRYSQASCPTVEVEEDAPTGGSGGGGIDKPVDNHSYSKCVVRYTYDRDTGEIFSWTVLYCY